jgi:hypothetical protein
MKSVWRGLVLALVLLGTGRAAVSVATDGIRIDPANPFYFQYDGQPVLLLGGSSGPPDALNDEGMFLWPDPIGSLDKLKAAGGNLVRCLMSGRLRGEPLWPYARIDSRYNLDIWNEEYWLLFQRFLTETKARGIVCEIEIWATFDYARLPWTKNPLNPTNNVNYTAAETGLPVSVDSHPVQSRNAFYHVIPEENNIGRVLEYQRRFVDKLLSYTLEHDHVLYCMDNEIGGSSKWGAYWAKHVREVARVAGKSILITEMFDPHDLSHPLFEEIVGHPEIYDYIEIAQNNHQTGQTHFDKILEMRQRIAAHPRPLSNVKIYGRTGPPFGTSKDGVDRFWRNIFGGCASARFHEKHLGDTELGLRMIRSARAVTGAFDLFHSNPRNDLLRDREADEAYCLANPGKEYAIYFPDGGKVRLDAKALIGEADVRWYDIDVGKWSVSHRVQGGAVMDLTAPRPGPWAALVTRVSPRTTPSPVD